MGYQEAFKPISHLAEAAGIREAVEEYRWRAELDRQREELRPKIARYLSENGPTRHQDMFKVKELAGYSQLGNVLSQLVWEGSLEEKHTRRTQRLPRYSLAQK